MRFTFFAPGTFKRLFLTLLCFSVIPYVGAFLAAFLGPFVFIVGIWSLPFFVGAALIWFAGRDGYLVGFNPLWAIIPGLFIQITVSMVDSMFQLAGSTPGVPLDSRIVWGVIYAAIGGVGSLIGMFLAKRHAPAPME